MIATGPVIRRRLALIMAAFLVLFLTLTTRLFVLGVVDAESLQKRAQSQWTRESVIAPRRGAILDRNGTVLAMSATAYTVSVSPRQVKDAAALGRVLAPILNVNADTIAQKSSDTSKGGVTLKRQVSTEVAQQIKLMLAEDPEQRLKGVYLEEDTKRYYPYGAFATQLLGLTTIDGVGQAGLERALNDYLSGKTGYIVSEIDGKGRTLSYSESEYVAAVNGGNVYLTIDAVIQGFAEKAAREALAVNQAEGVRVLVMNPKTAEILAIAMKPDFDPNEPPRNDIAVLTERMRNRVIADAYEPGSTFKIITSSIALETGVTSVNEGFYCSGSVYVDGGRIRCWGNPHGAESMAKALNNSCNPVFVELGLRIGVDSFYDYLDAFGFGRPSGVDIPGEAGGILIARNAVKRVDIARIGFGQSIAVTPLQLLTATCAAINGGTLLQPYVVSRIEDAEGNVIERGERSVVRQVISSQTSATMRTLLEDVVAHGGGKNAYIEGYSIGGKTGTAQVYINGVVSSSTHIGSFVGFAPMEDPVIAVLVIVDRANKSPDFGSVTAAPFARDILEQALPYLGIQRDSGAKATAKMVHVPDITGMSLTKAIAALREKKLTYLLNGTGRQVVDQLPAAGAEAAEGSIVMLYVDGASATLQDAYIEVPDVTGMSMTDANRLLASYQLSMVVEGSGIAVEQSPAAGENVYPTTEVVVTFASPMDTDIASG